MEESYHFDDFYQEALDDVAAYWWFVQQDEPKAFDNLFKFATVEEDKALKIIEDAPEHIRLIIYRQLHREHGITMDDIDSKIHKSMKKAFDAQKK